MDVLQAAPDWTGGISELAKICVLASAYDRPVVPHGHSTLPALHVIASQSPAVCPLLEFLMVHNPPKQWFHTYQVRPVGGRVPFHTMPGLGIELDETRILRRQALSWH